MKHGGERTSWGVSEYLCGKQAISLTLSTCGKVIQSPDHSLLAVSVGGKLNHC